MSATPMDREDILKAIEQLPLDEQLDMAQRIMRHYLAGSGLPHQTPALWVSWRKLAGIALPLGQTPPTDGEIAKWLDERRMKEAE